MEHSTERVTIRQLPTDQIMGYVVAKVAETVVRHWSGVPPRGEAVWNATLAMLPELHAQGIHAERLPTPNPDGTSAVQFAAFVPVERFMQFWGWTGTADDFEQMIRDVGGNVVTLRIGGVPTRVAEPFVLEVG